MDQAPAKEVTIEKKRKCEGADCENDAGALQCPTCQKLGKDSFFCSQDCFKRNWVGQCSLENSDRSRYREHGDSVEEL